MPFTKMALKRWSWLLLPTLVATQTVAPSNNSADISDPSTSPRFWLNATGSVQFPGFQLAPLDEYANIRRAQFLSISFSGYIVNTDPSNANKIDPNDFNYVSCDPEDYEGGNIDATSMLNIIGNQPTNARGDKSSLIFYSTRSSHCNASHLDQLPQVNGIFTTLDPVVAAQIKNRNFTSNSNAIATLTPDQTSFTAYGGSSSTPIGRGSTTAVAMIILYAITGIITGLFILIIISGAIRAHRHPERYGPRNVYGRPRQSRAKGIARAMLETIPIVKFGDHQDTPKPKDATKDVEMVDNNSSSSQVEVLGEKSAATAATTATKSTTDDATSRPKEGVDAISNADGSDEAGVLGCSICTEDFQKGEEVRVLPCNHKFHPDCVDPWLLNVSGTCPLCRINLAPEGDQSPDQASNTAGGIAPPLASAAPFGDRRSQAIHNLMSIAYGSREERVSALRRYRAERRNRSSQVPNVEERVSRARLFRDALRIRTRTHEPAAEDTETGSSSVNANAGSRTRT